MVETYDSILAEFNQKYRACPDEFYEYIQTAFGKANLINSKDGIDQIFGNILCSNHVMLNQIKYMIELGADPTICDNIAFYRALTYPNSDIALYLAETYNININADRLNDFYSKGSADTLRILLNKKLLILDKKIMSKLVVRACFIQVLMEEGIDFKEIIIGLIDSGTCILRDKEIYQIVMDQLNKDLVLENELLKSLFHLASTSCDLSVDGIKIFMDAGLDFNEIVCHFDILCKFNISIPLFIMNECQIDVNMNNGRALTIALETKRLDTVKLLLETGAKVLDSHIEVAILNQDAIEILITCGGISKEHVAKILANYFFNGMRRSKKMPDYIHIAKKFIHDGIDFNKIISNINDKDIPEHMYGCFMVSINDVYYYYK